MLCTDGFRPNIDEAELVSFVATDIFDEKKLRGLIEMQILCEDNYYRETGIDISDDRTVLLVEI